MNQESIAKVAEAFGVDQATLTPVARRRLLVLVMMSEIGGLDAAELAEEGKKSKELQAWLETGVVPDEPPPAELDQFLAFITLAQQDVVDRLSRSVGAYLRSNGHADADEFLKAAAAEVV